MFGRFLDGLKVKVSPKSEVVEASSRSTLQTERAAPPPEIYIRNRTDQFKELRSAQRNATISDAKDPGIMWFDLFVSGFAKDTLSEVDLHSIATFHNSLVGRTSRLMNEFKTLNVKQCRRCERSFGLLGEKPTCCSVCSWVYCGKCVCHDLPVAKIACGALGLRDDIDLSSSELKEFEEDNTLELPCFLRNRSSDNETVASVKRLVLTASQERNDPTRETSRMSFSGLRNMLDRQSELKMCQKCFMLLRSWLWTWHESRVQHPVTPVYTRLLEAIRKLERYLPQLWGLAEAATTQGMLDFEYIEDEVNHLNPTVEEDASLEDLTVSVGQSERSESAVSGTISGSTPSELLQVQIPSTPPSRPHTPRQGGRELDSRKQSRTGTLLEPVVVSMRELIREADTEFKMTFKLVEHLDMLEQSAGKCELLIAKAKRIARENKQPYIPVLWMDKRNSAELQWDKTVLKNLASWGRTFQREHWIPFKSLRKQFYAIEDDFDRQALNKASSR